LAGILKFGIQIPPAKQSPENFKTLGVFSWWCREMAAAPGKHLLHVWLGNGVSVAQRSELERCGAGYPQVRITAQVLRGTPPQNGAAFGLARPNP
jgi:hypothetical protein